MDKNKYLKNITEKEIDKNKVNQILEKYKIKLSDYVSKVISMSEESYFIAEERRTLSFDEILNLDKEFNIDFSSIGIIPVIDCCDNDYIVYIINEDKWGKYNLSDNILFKKRDNLEDII